MQSEPKMEKLTFKVLMRHLRPIGIIFLVALIAILSGNRIASIDSHGMSLLMKSVCVISSRVLWAFSAFLLFCVVCDIVTLIRSVRITKKVQR